MSFFDEAVEKLLAAEGGLLISDSEHGGGANMGVSLTVLQEYYKDPSLTLNDLIALTRDEAIEIYRTMYWNKILGDQILGRLSAIALLDQAVNRGLGGLRKQLVRTLVKHFKDDVQDIGPYDALIKRVNAIPDRVFMRRFVHDVELSYVDMAIRDPAKLKWLRGWLIRCHNLIKLLV